MKVYLLTNEDVAKLSSIVKIPIPLLSQLYSMGMLNWQLARDKLILNDYRIIRRKSKYTSKQIILALMNQYNVSRSKVEEVVYLKREKRFFCLECGEKIGKTDSIKNDGLCDKCLAKTIEKVK